MDYKLQQFRSSWLELQKFGSEGFDLSIKHLLVYKKLFIACYRGLT